MRPQPLRYGRKLSTLIAQRHDADRNHTCEDVIEQLLRSIAVDHRTGVFEQRVQIAQQSEQVRRRHVRRQLRHVRQAEATLGRHATRQAAQKGAVALNLGPLVVPDGHKARVPRVG